LVYFCGRSITPLPVPNRQFLRHAAILPIEIFIRNHLDPMAFKAQKRLSTTRVTEAPKRVMPKESGRDSILVKADNRQFV